MVAKIVSFQARHYRALRSIDVGFNDHFHVLVGPNGSGKSTLFDALGFLFDLFQDDLAGAVSQRTRNFQDLVWNQFDTKRGFQLAIEFEFSTNIHFRYEIEVRELPEGVKLTTENGFLGRLSKDSFDEYSKSDSILTNDWRDYELTPVFLGGYSSDDKFQSTTFFIHSGESGSIQESVRFGHDNTSIEAARFVDGLDTGVVNPGEKKSRKFSLGPIIEYITQLNRTSVRLLQLNNSVLRQARPMNGGDFRLAQTGDNLPWVVKRLKEEHQDLFDAWLDHIKIHLDHVENIDVRERQDDRHAYLTVTTVHGVEVPSWGASEGTLRFIALTLIAYLPYQHPVVYLLEEPENGIHPLAVEGVYESLSSVYHSQVFVASHSPAFLRCVSCEEVLCFSRSLQGVSITPGPLHPRLQDWQEAVDSDLFFAPTILS